MLQPPKFKIDTSRLLMEVGVAFLFNLQSVHIFKIKNES